jgi:hypothetical protein
MRTDSPSLLLLLSRHRLADDLCARQRADGISRRPVVPLFIAARYLGPGYLLRTGQRVTVAMVLEDSVA